MNTQEKKQTREDMLEQANLDLQLRDRVQDQLRQQINDYES